MSHKEDLKLNKASREGFDIPTRRAAVSPLDAVRDSVMQNTRQLSVEQPEAEAPTPSLAPTTEKKSVEACDEKPKQRVTKTSTLLAKCMPYIYDDDGVNYAEEKPNYTLESVEDIIQSAERRANEKIARMYNLKSSDIENIGKEKEEQPEEPQPRARLTHQTGSFKRAIRIGEEPREDAARFDTVSIPKVSNTLFDDFSARRTEVAEGDNVTTTYTELGQRQVADGHTRAIPDMKVETHTREIYEDILSHTRPTDVVDLPSSTVKKAIALPTDDEPEAVPDDFGGAHDIKRVGTDLKLEALLGRIRFYATLMLTAVVGIFQIPSVAATVNSTLITVVTLVCFVLAALINYNVFGGFKKAFTSTSRTELPAALALSATTICLVFGIILGNYSFHIVLPALFALTGYGYAAKRHAASVFANFRLVAARKEKKAVTLIGNTEVTSAMARGTIEGEVLVAGAKPTDEIADFLKNTRADRAFGGKMGGYAIACLVAAGIIALTVGISMGSFMTAIEAAAMVLCLSAAPSVWVADIMPFAGLTDRLKGEKAAVCSKYSAARIEEANAAVFSSSEIFPQGCIKIYDIRPLDANNIDETLIMAAAVAKECNSPLYPMFIKMVTTAIDLPAADTVKYEDNLGISGWAGDKHIMVGNRSLMQAHGVRVPALEVDRKILHKGYFPIYIACEQRACALLVVKYTVDRKVEAELHRLADAGVTLLIDNSDPNITEEMLCDYYSLYPDIVKILDHNGTHKYRKTTEKEATASAHGFYLGDPIGFMALLTGCIRTKRLSTALYIAHIICAVMLWLFFAGFSLGGSMEIMSAAVALLCQAAATVISLIIYFIAKP